MNIENAKYTEDGSISALIDGQQMYIPADPSNRHYAAILEQGAAVAVADLPSIIDLRAQALAAILLRIEALTAQFTAGYPSAEIQSWPTKAAEAAIVLAGGASAMIAAEATARGKTPQDMAATIATNAAYYTTIIGAMSGVRGSAGEAIAAAVTPEDVAAALGEALAAGQAAAANLGLEF